MRGKNGEWTVAKKAKKKTGKKARKKPIKKKQKKASAKSRSDAAPPVGANLLLTFDYWKQHLSSRSHAMSPETCNEISAQTVFLWITESYQMGACLGGGAFWIWFPDAQSTAAYLRHCYFPHCFGDWLVRQEWDADEQAIRSAEDIFSLAEKADKCRYKNDIPKMKEVTALFDSAMAEKKTESCLARIDEALRLFASSGISDGSMSFDVSVVGHLAEMRDNVLKRFSECDTDEDIEDSIGVTPENWKQLTQSGEINQEKSGQIAELLDELVQF
jgi:hypothetical protein